MKKLFLLSGLLCSFFSAHAATADLVSPKLILDCAKDAGVIAESEKQECFSVGEDGALYELHNKKCGGDRRTQPARAFFNVKLVDGFAYLGYEYGGDEWTMCSYIKH